MFIPYWIDLCHLKLRKIIPRENQLPTSQPAVPPGRENDDEIHLNETQTRENTRSLTETLAMPPFVLEDNAPDDLKIDLLHIYTGHRLSLNQNLEHRHGDMSPSDPVHALTAPDFLWGKISGNTFCDLVSSAYTEVVHWRRNVFLIPSGKAGKTFITELAKLYQAYADASTLECIALKACTVMQCLLLRKPHAKSKAKEHSAHSVQRSCSLWVKG